MEEEDVVLDVRVEVGDWKVIGREGVGNNAREKGWSGGGGGGVGGVIVGGLVVGGVVWGGWGVVGAYLGAFVG